MAVTQTAPRAGLTVSKSHKVKEKNDLWPGIGARRRDDVARRLDRGRFPARQRRWRRRGCMRASRCRARTRVKQARQKGPEGRCFYPLPGHAWWFVHGGARVGAHGCGKKTRLTRPAATHERTRPRRLRWHTESPKDLTVFPCSRAHSASRVVKATAAQKAGRRCARRKEKGTKGSALASQVGARACEGARLCDGTQDFTGARARTCRRLGHGGRPERRRMVRRPKELEVIQSTTRVQRGRQRHLQEEETQPGTKADITSGEHGGAVANGGVSPLARRLGHPQRRGETRSHFGGHGP
jgi:hypothetical protein